MQKNRLTNAKATSPCDIYREMFMNPPSIKKCRYVLYPGSTTRYVRLCKFVKDEASMEKAKIACDESVVKTNGNTHSLR